MSEQPDAVAQARAELEAAMSWLTTDESHRVDALIAAVRAECAAKEGNMRLVGWMAVDAQGERMADEMFVSSVVALREWPTCHPLPLYTYPLAALEAQP